MHKIHAKKHNTINTKSRLTKHYIKRVFAPGILNTACMICDNHVSFTLLCKNCDPLSLAELSYFSHTVGFSSI